MSHFKVQVQSSWQVDETESWVYAPGTALNRNKVCEGKDER